MVGQNSLGAGATPPRMGHRNPHSSRLCGLRLIREGFHRRSSQGVLESLSASDSSSIPNEASCCLTPFVTYAVPTSLDSLFLWKIYRTAWRNIPKGFIAFNIFASKTVSSFARGGRILVQGIERHLRRIVSFITR